MRIVLQIVSYLALAGTVLPSVAFLVGKMDLDQVGTAMLIAAVVWFVVTPMWMGREKAGHASDS